MLRRAPRIRRVHPALMATVAALALHGVALEGCGGSSSGGGGGGSTSPPALGASGSRAADYLTSNTYTDLLVEVDYVQGVAPDTAALALLEQRLAERCDKPGGITVTLDDAIPSPGTDPWTLSSLQAFEQQHRDAASAGTTAVLYFLYVDGGWETDSQSSRLLGLSHTGSSLAIFKENIQGAATTFTVRQIEEAVLVHEAGHAFGLVNNGTPMVTPHEDASHAKHDDDASCVMYYAVETSLVDQLLGTVPDQFDAECIADMQAAGGR